MESSGLVMSGELQTAMVKRSLAMERMVAQAEAAARTDATVLITGETGAGKDVVARFIHAKSDRNHKEIVSVNCGAFCEQLFEAEFFGHDKGAFTGASSARVGLLEAADGSTLFLDEVGDLPPLMQVKLLRFLEDGSFRRVGSSSDKRVDVRIIAATNRDLERDMRDGTFRADLYYRLNVITLFVPPLRERREEIGELADTFLAIFRAKFRRPQLTLSPEARHKLQEYNWPGNVRQLRNCVERVCALATDDLIDEADLMIKQHANLQLVSDASGHEVAAVASTHPRLLVGSRMTLADVERSHIESILDQVDGNREQAAAILGISSRTLYRKLKEFEGDVEGQLKGVA